MGKTLVVFYSESGHTRRAANRIAALLGAELEEIRAQGLWRGLGGYLQRIWLALRALQVGIAPPQKDPRNFARVLICSPVWAGHVSSPMRSYLIQMTGRLPEVAFVLTSGGRDVASALAEMAQLAGRTPLAEVAISARDRRRQEVEGKLDAFLAKLGEAERAKSAA